MDEVSDEIQIVVFSVGDEEFGVNINEIREIIRIPNITKVPDVESYVEGVINLRGGIVVILDLCKKLNLTAKEADKNSRILVVDTGQNQFGMIVDSATEVLRLTKDQIQTDFSKVAKTNNKEYLQGVGVLGDRLLLLLDLAKMVTPEQIKELEGKSTV